MIDNLSIAVHVFREHTLTSVSVDEILLPRYVDLSANFRSLRLIVGMTQSCLKHINTCLICVHKKTNASSCLLQVMRLQFGVDRCIFEKKLIICVVCILDWFWSILFASCFFFYVKPFSLFDLLIFVVSNLDRL